MRRMMGKKKNENTYEDHKETADKAEKIAKGGKKRVSWNSGGLSWIL